MGRAMNLTNRRIATWCMLQYNKGKGKLFKIFKQMKNQGEANVEAYLHGLGIWRDLLFETKKKKKAKITRGSINGFAYMKTKDFCPSKNTTRLTTV